MTWPRQFPHTPEPRELSWKDQAACLGTNPDLFFPPKWDHGTDAKRVCAGCPVSDDCLEYALAEHIDYGIWGGTSQRERTRIRKAERRGAA